MNFYPKTVNETFTRNFELLKEAKQFAKEHNSTPKKICAKNYNVNYIDSRVNFYTTGRKFFVIDKDLKVSHEIVTITKNIIDKSLNIIEGFEGIYITKGGLKADIFIEVSLLNNPIANNIVTHIINKEEVRYSNIREVEKQSVREAFLKTL